VEPPIASDIVAYLIHAIYFKGDWSMSFNKSPTRPAPLTLRAGDTTPVQMMSHGVMVDIGLHVEPDVVVFDLPYGGSAFSMTVVLPRTAGGGGCLVLFLSLA